MLIKEMLLTNPKTAICTISKVWHLMEHCIVSTSCSTSSGKVNANRLKYLYNLLDSACFFVSDEHICLCIFQNL